MTRTTDKFFSLVESTFTVDTITPEKIVDEFYSGDFGKVKWGKDRAGKQRMGKSKATREGQSVFLGLADRLAMGREIYEQIDIEKDYDKLRELRNQAKGLDIYSKEVTEKVENKMEIISKEMVEISEERREERIREIEEEEREKKLEERIRNIEEDIDAIEDLSDLDNVKRKIKILSKKDVDISDLEGRIEEIRKGLEVQRETERVERLKMKQNKDLNKLINKISSTRAMNELYRLEGKLDNFDEIDTTEARGLINERLAEIEEEKEANIRRQEESRLEKEKLRAEGILDLG